MVDAVSYRPWTESPLLLPRPIDAGGEVGQEGELRWKERGWGVRGEEGFGDIWLPLHRQSNYFAIHSFTKHLPGTFHSVDNLN